MKTHARQHISSVYNTFLHAEDKPVRVRLVSLISVPLQARAYLSSDWLAMILWCSNSKPKRPGLGLI